MEELLVQGKTHVDQAFDLALLLIDMLSIEVFVVKWKESIKHTEDIKSLLKFNECKISSLIEQSVGNLTIKQIFEKVLRSNCEEYESNPNCIYYAKINKIFEEIILFMMKDTRQAKNKEPLTVTNHSQLKQMLIDTINKCYSYQFNSIEEQLGMFVNNSSPKCKVVDLENLGASFLFPLLNYLTDSNLLRVDAVSVEPWINRTTENSWFYNEVGVGGTITHLMKEYYSNVKGNTLLNLKPCDFNGELHHRIMKLSYIVLKELGRYYIDLKQNSDNTLVVDPESIKDRGNELIYNMIRPLYSVYSIRNQGVLYAYSFFILKLVHHLKETQKEVLYFMPKFVLEIPINAFTTLMSLNSPYLNYGSWFELQIRGKNELFSSNDYITLLLSFYNDILKDEKINNPEIVEIVIKAINSFVMNPIAVKTYINDKKLLTDFLMAQVKYLSSESLSNLVFTNIFELIKPACLKFDLSHSIKLLIKNSVATCFESNREFYKKFLDDYSNLLNKNLTKYCNYLEELVKESTKIMNYSTQTQIIRTYFLQFHSSLVYLYEALMIYEVIIYASPDILDLDSLGFSMLMQIIGTISTRIICLPYIKSAIDFSTTYKSETINELYLAIIGLFCQLKEKVDASQIKERFVKKLVTTGIDFKPFLEISNKNFSNFKALQPEIITNYCSIIEDLIKTSNEFSSDTNNVSLNKHLYF